MEVSFSPDTEAQLQQVAASAGKTPAQFVEDTVNKALGKRTEYLAAVDHAIAAADRGELVEHEEALQRIARLFAP